MARKKWHITNNEDGLVLSRRLPVRMDVMVETVLPQASPLRIAHQIRQDLWRALQNLRGFAPVVEVVQETIGLRIRAGGEIGGQFRREQVEQVVAGVLENASNRARWVRFATCGQKET